MEKRKIGNNLTKGLPEAKRGAFSRRSVLTLVGTLGAAAPFGMFGAARALTASGAWIAVLYSWRASYLPHRGEQRRAAGPAPPAQTRLERERGLHGRCAGRKGTGYLRQAQPRCRFRQFRRFDRPVVRGDRDWQGGCRFGVGPALAQADGARFRRSDHRRCARRLHPAPRLQGCKY